MFPSLHTCQLSGSHQTFPNSKDTRAKYIILMDGFINSRALEPLNSALKSFTMVCNLLIGIYESSLRGKKEEASLACWRHRAGFCSCWLLPPAGEKRVPHLSLLGPLAWLSWGEMPAQAGKLPLCSSMSTPCPRSGHLSQWQMPLLMIRLATAHLVHIHCWGNDLKVTKEGTGMARASATTAGQQGPIAAGTRAGGGRMAPGEEEAGWDQGRRRW